MALLVKRVVGVFAAVSALFFTSCEKEFSEVGVSTTDKQVQIEKKQFPIYAYNKRYTQVQTNALSTYQLGRYTSAVYGENTAAIAAQLSLSSGGFFGEHSQAEEDASVLEEDTSIIPEKETVTAAYITIPFFSEASETDQDGNTTYVVDSIYGNKQATLQLKIKELTYYLRDFDPTTNLIEDQKYYSSADFTSFTGATLFDGPVSLQFTEIVDYKKDDPTTTENESEQIDRRLSPALRVPLDIAFFQQRILDKEGTDVLRNNANFKEYLRGLHISADTTEDLLLLLDLSKAVLDIEYTYEKLDKGSLTDASDDVVYLLSKRHSFALSANKVNTFSNTAYSQDVMAHFTSENASKLYLNGKAGSYAKIHLFDTPGQTTVLEELKAEQTMINDAKITFFVDQASLGAEAQEPNRIYLFNLEDGTPILDYTTDLVNTTSPLSSKKVYGGILTKDASEKGVSYTINITKHLVNILQNNADNVSLGLVVSANINNIVTAKATNASLEQVFSVSSSVSNPLGTVLHGSAALDKDKQMKLEIYYTQPKK